MTAPTFPTLAGKSRPIIRSPIWSTVKPLAVSGKSTRISLWTYPRWRWRIPFAYLRSDDQNTEWQQLVGFFNTVRGASGVFEYRDITDGAAADQAFGTGNGAETEYQLVRTLGTFVEPVFAPSGTPTIKIDGVATGAATVGETGLVTFDVAPAIGEALTWSGDYNWLCSFDDDSADFRLLMHEFWDLGQISFTSEKLS